MAGPDENDIFQWYFLIFGLDKPYSGGYYMGKIIFPKEYPLKPPAILMLTPSGRFETNMRICFSMSDYHPETWSVAWTTETIMVGLISFMYENEITYGGIDTSNENKMALAAKSLKYTAGLPKFAEIFGDDLHLTGLTPEEIKDLNLKKKERESTAGGCNCSIF